MKRRATSAGVSYGSALLAIAIAVIAAPQIGNLGHSIELAIDGRAAATTFSSSMPAVASTSLGGLGGSSSRAARATSGLARRSTRADFATLAGRIGKHALPASPRVLVDDIPPATKKALVDAYRSAGYPNVQSELQSILDVDTGLNRGAVGELRAEILTNPEHASEVERWLGGGQYRRGYTASEHFDPGHFTHEDQLYRVQMYLMSVPEAFHQRLRDAVRADSHAMGEVLSDSIAAGSNDFDALVVGSGPTGLAMAFELLKHNKAGSTLFVDEGFGAGTFGKLEFDLNSQINSSMLMPNIESPMAQASIRVEDLAHHYNQRVTRTGHSLLRDFWRSSMLHTRTRESTLRNLHPRSTAYAASIEFGLYEAQLKGVPILPETNARLLGVGSEGPEQGLYKYALSRGKQEHAVFAEQPIYATGWKTAHLPSNLGPSEIMDQDVARLRAARNPQEQATALSESRILPYDAPGLMSNPHAFWDADDTVLLLGAGDGARVFLEETVFDSTATPKWVTTIDPADLNPRYVGRWLTMYSELVGDGRSPLNAFAGNESFRVLRQQWVDTIEELPDGRFRVSFRNRPNPNLADPNLPRSQRRSSPNVSRLLAAPEPVDPIIVDKVVVAAGTTDRMQPALRHGVASFEPRFVEGKASIPTYAEHDPTLGTRFETEATPLRVASALEGRGDKDVIVLGPPSGAHKEPTKVGGQTSDLQVLVGASPPGLERLGSRGVRLSFLQFYARATEAAARRFMNDFHRAP